VLATANPIEYEGTYPARAPLTGRCGSLRLPASNEEYDYRPPESNAARRKIEFEVGPDPAGLRGLQAAVRDVRVDESVGRYCVALAAATRESPRHPHRRSPRGSSRPVLTAPPFRGAARPRLLSPET